MAKKHLKKNDPNEVAFSILKQATKGISLKGKNPAAVALGRLGGLKGGKARAQALTAERRREIARKAANRRWESNKK